MRQVHGMFGLITLIVLLSLVACSSVGSAPAAEAVVADEAAAIDEETAAEGTATAEPMEEAAVSAPLPDSEFDILAEFDPSQFDDPTTVNNQWFPIQPGTQFHYEGVTIEDGEEIPHRIIFTATDLTKEIEGVRTVVMWDRDFSDDELVEAEIALFAQDNAGNVWHFGQYPEEYEEGELVGFPAWLAGYEDAQPGITVKAEPEIGGASYSQGWGPAVDWTDRARAVRFEDGVCVLAGCYDGVLVTEETARGEGSFQLKYYAPGVGNIYVGWTGDDETKETLELVKIVQLSPEELAEARAEALELEARAYENVPEIFGETAPME